MASEFVGLTVKVILSSGLIVTGYVSDINQKMQQLILDNATVTINNVNQSYPSYVVQSTEIKDLKITSDKRVKSPIQQYKKPQVQPTVLSPQIVPLYSPNINILNTPTTTKTNFINENPSPIPFQTQNNIPYIDPAIVSYSQQTVSDNNSDATSSNSTQKILSTPLTSVYQSKKINPNASIIKANESNIDDEEIEDYDRIPAQRKMKKKNQKLYLSKERSKSVTSNSSKGNSRYNTSPGRQRRGRKNEINQWANGDVNLYKDEEFDFQSNLNLFDKKKEWAKIRETDCTAPETLLVNLNRIKKNISGAPLPYNHDSPLQGHRYYESSQVKLGIHENVLDSVVSETDVEYESSNDDSDYSKHSRPGMTKSRVMFENLSRVLIPAINVSEASLLDHLTVNEYRIKEEITIENSGRDTAMMVIQALGGNRRINVNNHNSAPFVVVLAGNNKSGANAINAAKHLLNHECQVLVCLAACDTDIIKSVAYQKSVYTQAGGECIYQASNLPTKAVDLIIDGIIGVNQNINDIKKKEQKACIKGMIEWANSIQTPVLSLECPSGVDPNTGVIINPKSYIKTKWTLALGLPLTGLINNDLTGEIILGDIGIPKIIYKTLGLKPNYRPPFADKFIINIELSKKSLR